MLLNFRKESSKYWYTCFINSSVEILGSQLCFCANGDRHNVGPTVLLNSCNSCTTDLALYKQRVNSIKLRSLFDSVDDIGVKEEGMKDEAKFIRFVYVFY